MRIISARVENFGSYKKLEFSFDNKGLTLISGPTGAGKSTLCDIIPWVLFGVTSKGGVADEVRNWNTDSPTEGEVVLEIGSKQITVVRLRSKNAKDLYYLGDNAGKNRGKDLNDTQKLINELLGLTADLYLSGAYFHEFSQSAQFFTTTAKNRRQITEQIADLSLSKNLIEIISVYKKELKSELDKTEKELLIAEDRYKRSRDTEEQYQTQLKAWHEKQAAKIAQAKANYDNFEKNKQRAINKINASIAYESEQYNTIANSIRDSKNQRNQATIEVERIAKLIATCDSEICQQCGSPKQNDKRRQLVRDLQRFESEVNSAVADLKCHDMDLRRLEVSIKLMNDNLIKERQKENNWSNEYEALLIEQHPFAESNGKEIKDLVIRVKSLRKIIDLAKIDLSDLELLSSVNDQFRGLLIKNTIANLENYTNKLLTNHFDAEIRVSFSATSADKLDVTIYKDGHLASFTQLSKGQRQLLKLTFGISVMRSVSNHNGVSFNAIFLDEFADGLDEKMKIKAFSLVNGLTTEYESVFCIDHSEQLKSMFDNKIEVSLINGNSEIG